METMNVMPENLVKAITIADPEVAKVLVTLFGLSKEEIRAFATGCIEAKKPITERVKTYEDACRELGIEPMFFTDGEEPDEVAYVKLKTIVRALNEGWMPTAENELKDAYVPTFQIYSEFEAKDALEGDKMLIIDNYYNTDAYAIACGRAASGPHIYMSYGSRLCLATKELAEYCGDRFVGLWADLRFVRK